MSLKIPNLDKIWLDQPLLGEALAALTSALDNLGQKLSVNPQGRTEKPPALAAINVTASASGIHRVSVIDHSPRTRNLETFVEHSVDPQFGPGAVQVEHLGVGRQRSIPQAMGATPVYYRAYTMYRDSVERSDYIYLGSASSPTGVIDHAVTAGPPHHASTGSGTSTEGGHGFGREQFVSAPTAPGKPPKVYR